MYIGLGIFLIVIGAIMSFAIQDAIAGVNLVMIGYICIAGGVLAIVLSLLMGAGRRGDREPPVR
ncbi:DUF6458 family protein [Janibacter sp. GXQ6167]|uniref:DUF6458 family protein n=1 Tax=Janibacter sp. GXQ6167 TaxID=3240791 RepID=UPI003523E9B2